MPGQNVEQWQAAVAAKRAEQEQIGGELETLMQEDRPCAVIPEWGVTVAPNEDGNVLVAVGGGHVTIPADAVSEVRAFFVQQFSGGGW